jgi:hypothetical protein
MLHDGLNLAEALIVDVISWEAVKELDKCWIPLGGFMALYIQAVREDWIAYVLLRRSSGKYRGSSRSRVHGLRF